MEKMEKNTGHYGYYSPISGIILQQGGFISWNLSGPWVGSPRGEEAPLKMYQTRKAKLGKLGGHIRKNWWWFRSSDVSFSFFLAAQEGFLEHQHDQQWREVQGPCRKPSFDPAHLLEDEEPSSGFLFWYKKKLAGVLDFPESIIAPWK